MMRFRWILYIFKIFCKQIKIFFNQLNYNSYASSDKLMTSSFNSTCQLLWNPFSARFWFAVPTIWVFEKFCERIGSKTFCHDLYRLNFQVCAFVFVSTQSNEFKLMVLLFANYSIKRFCKTVHWLITLSPKKKNSKYDLIRFHCVSNPVVVGGV